MPKTRTHYDELNVARDASPEDIKKAYRKLAQQLHPDRNHEANASDLMGIVNASHDVLADPVKRAEYDASLIRGAQQAREAATRRRQAASGAGGAVPASKPKPAGGAAPKASSKASRPARRGSRLRWAAVFLVFCGAGAWMGYDREAGKPFVPPPLPDEAPVTVTASPPPEVAAAPTGNPTQLVDPSQPQCVPPPSDPLGAPWPAASGYINGLPMTRDGGWSEITLDNTAGEEAVYAKVTDASGKHAYRHAFVPARGTFTFQRMDVGFYLLKYKMLNTGCAYASSRIHLEETFVGNRIKSSVYKLTLRKLQSRNTQFSNVRSDDF